MILKKRSLYKYILFSLIGVVFTFIMHEFAHWTIGESLGYKMRMTLNKVYPISGGYERDWHYTTISLAGPVITLLQAIVFFLIIGRNGNKNLFPFLFTCFYLELLSGVMNYRNPNDLGRISTSLDLGLFTLPIIFITIHFLMLYMISMREKYRLSFLVITLLLTILFTSIWILSNQFYHIVLI